MAAHRSHSIIQLNITRRLAALLLALFCVTAHAYSSYDAPGEADLDNHHTYRNSDGDSVHSPAHSRSGQIPSGATAQCRDGTFSFSQHRSGTCSRHGGVASWQ